MHQFVAEYWLLWIVLFVGLRCYIKYNNSCRKKRIEALGIKRDYAGLTDEEIKQQVLRVLSATLTGAPQVLGAAILSWVTVLLFIAALFQIFK